MPKARSSFMSCHASHAQASSDSTSKLFKKLVDYVKSSRPSLSDDVVDLIAVEILNRTLVLNLTPPGDLQYDEPNVPTIERLTHSRIYWTFAYDTPLKPVTRQTKADADEVRNIRSRIVEAILKTTLNMSETHGTSELRVTFTTAPPPTVRKSVKDVYSLIEFTNAHISASNLFDVASLKGDMDAAVHQLTESVDHTRFYIGVKEGTPTNKANAIMTAFYKSMIQALHAIDGGKDLLRKHSNELAYFSPNALEVLRSLLPALNSFQHDTSVDIKSQVSHPFLEHTEVATGYSLMCGPDIRLHKGKDEIAYTRIVGTHELRFPPSLTSLVDQLKIHFGSWIGKIQLTRTKTTHKDNVKNGKSGKRGSVGSKGRSGVDNSGRGSSGSSGKSNGSSGSSGSSSEKQKIKSFPAISTFVLVIHACNQCKTKSDSGKCECYLNIDPVSVQHGHQYERNFDTDMIERRSPTHGSNS